MLLKERVQYLCLFGLLISCNTNAATYEVSGTFTKVGVYEESGGNNLIVDGSANLVIGGYIVTDSDQPGYSIIDGELTYSGDVITNYPPFGSGLVEYDYSRGYPSNDGVSFYQGGLLQHSYQALSGRYRTPQRSL